MDRLVDRVTPPLLAVAVCFASYHGLVRMLRISETSTALPPIGKALVEDGAPAEPVAPLALPPLGALIPALALAFLATRVRIGFDSSGTLGKLTRMLGNAVRNGAIAITRGGAR